MEGIMKTARLAAISLASLLVSSAALAQQAGKVDNIGNAGQFVFGVDRVTGLAFNHVTNRQTTTVVVNPITGATATDTQKTRDTYTQVSFLGSSQPPILSTGYPVPVLVPRLAFDYLPIDGLTVGGSFMVIHQTGETKAQDTTPGFPNDLGNKHEVSSTLVLFEPRVGYALPFNNILGLWPRAGFEWYHASTSDRDLARTPAQGSSKAWGRGDLYQLALEVMLVISPFPHVAILVGPYADIGLGGSGRMWASDTNPAGVTTIGPSQEQHPLMNSFGLTSSLVAYFP
jgi:hypothetical protein